MIKIKTNEKIKYFLFFILQMHCYIVASFEKRTFQLEHKVNGKIYQKDLIDFMEQCQSGDLAFFDNGKGHITHVGIILPDCHIIHSSGRVRIDKLDHFGIFNRETNRYSHQLRIVKRLLSDEIETPKSVVESAKNEDELSAQSLLFS